MLAILLVPAENDNMNQELQQKSFENIQDELRSLKQQYSVAIDSELDLLRLKELRFKIKQAEEKLRHINRRSQSDKFPGTPVL